MINLQGVGQVETIKASDLIVGDIVMFNFGITSVVHSFGNETAKFMEIEFFNPENKSLTTAKYKKDKQVCRMERS